MWKYTHIHLIFGVRLLTINSFYSSGREEFLLIMNIFIGPNELYGHDDKSKGKYSLQLRRCELFEPTNSLILPVISAM